MTVGCIYRHLSMDSAEFNDLYLQNLLDTLAFENKDIIESFSGNITTTISDLYVQFLLLKSNNLPKGQKERRLIRDYKNDSFEIFFETFNKILDKHAPLRKLSI